MGFVLYGYGEGDEGEMKRYKCIHCGFERETDQADEEEIFAPCSVCGGIVEWRMIK